MLNLPAKKNEGSAKGFMRTKSSSRIIALTYTKKKAAGEVAPASNPLTGQAVPERSLGAHGPLFFSRYRRWPKRTGDSSITTS
jgi:hypothetical protein